MIFHYISLYLNIFEYAASIAMIDNYHWTNYLQASLNRGFLSIQDLKDMARGSGAKSIVEMGPQWPLGVS